MAKKTKTNKVYANVAHVANAAGVLMMTAAATIGMVELPNHPNKVAITSQPILEAAQPGAPGENFMNELGQIRREREETHPHAISFSVNQRTPGRTGRA